MCDMLWSSMRARRRYIPSCPVEPVNMIFISLDLGGPRTFVDRRGRSWVYFWIIEVVLSHKGEYGLFYLVFRSA